MRPQPKASKNGLKRCSDLVPFPSENMQCRRVKLSQLLSLCWPFFSRSRLLNKHNPNMGESLPLCTTKHEPGLRLVQRLTRNFGDPINSHRTFNSVRLLPGRCNSMRCCKCSSPRSSLILVSSLQGPKSVSKGFGCGGRSCRHLCMRK